MFIIPELPDVQSIKQYIDATSLHKKITRVEVKDDSVLEITPQTLRKHIESQSFKETKRTGKHLFLSADLKWLTLHFGMTGNVNYAEDSDTTSEHTLFLFHFNNGGRLAYISQRKLGSVDITNQPEQFCEEHGLGEDALQVDLKTFRKLLEDKRGMIKTALMDQSTIAGIGNVYSVKFCINATFFLKRKLKNLQRNRLNTYITPCSVFYKRP